MHEETAVRLDNDDRPQRAAWHRNVATINRARAAKLENEPSAPTRPQRRSAKDAPSGDST
jgi:hypothetical protein